MVFSTPEPRVLSERRRFWAVLAVDAPFSGHGDAEAITLSGGEDAVAFTLSGGPCPQNGTLPRSQKARSASACAPAKRPLCRRTGPNYRGTSNTNQLHLLLLVRRRRACYPVVVRGRLLLVQWFLLLRCGPQFLLLRLSNHHRLPQRRTLPGRGPAPAS